MQEKLTEESTECLVNGVDSYELTTKAKIALLTQRRCLYQQSPIHQE